MEQQILDKKDDKKQPEGALSDTDPGKIEPGADEPGINERPLKADPAASMIDQANKAAERLETANKETAALLATQQKMYVQNTLGGKATAGSKELTADEKAEEGAKKLIAGSGFEHRLFPPKT